MEVKLTALPPPLTLPNVVFHSVYIYTNDPEERLQAQLH